MHISDETIHWLLEGPPWVQYRTRLDILQQPEDAPEVEASRQAILAHPQVQAILGELAQWPVSTIASHKSAGHALHKLAFIADLGLRAGDPPIDQIVSRILDHQDSQGPFQVLMNIPVQFGGTGTDQWAWALCDAPLVVYALVSFGMGADPRVQPAIHHLAGLGREIGWPCAVSAELGTFRGPGRKDDPCPYATLAMLKVLSLLPEWRDSAAARAGTESLLALWADRRERHPYMFFMGTDFCKLKAPLVWYDILHVLSVLAEFAWVHHDPRFEDMQSVVSGRGDRVGRFTPESVWTAWREWDFGQKKQPSRWLTLIATRSLMRALN